MIQASRGKKKTLGGSVFLYIETQEVGLQTPSGFEAHLPSH